MPTEMNIAVPAALDGVVEDSLRTVGKLHRRKLIKRAGSVLSGLAVAFGAFLILGATNPALAAQVPFFGAIFRQASTKTGSFSQNVEGYGVVHPLQQQAVSEQGVFTMTAAEGYSDGETIQVGLELAVPQEISSRYEELIVAAKQNGKTCSAKVNGEEAQVDSAGLFTRQEEVWSSVVRLLVPESQKSAEEFQVELVLRDLEEWSGKEVFAGEYAFSFTLKADRSHTAKFTGLAQDNGASVLAVESTPASVRITVEKPYWGEPHGLPVIDEPDCHPAGYPHLYTMDGEEVMMDSRSHTSGGGNYDYNLRETQTADLYFDSLPAGETQAVFRFLEGDGSSQVLAEFTIDFETGTVVPAGTRSWRPEAK